MGGKAELYAAGAMTLLFFSLVAAIAFLQPAPQMSASIHSERASGNAPPVVRVVEPVAPEARPLPAIEQQGAAHPGPVMAGEPMPVHESPPEKNSVFDIPILGEFADVVKLQEVIVTGNAFLCSSGRLDACRLAEANTTERVGNDTVFYPFRGRPIEEGESGCARDADDEYTVANYDLANLYACAANARDVRDIFICAIRFNKENGGMCLSSTSAFKLAYCSSPLAREKQPFQLYKAFVADGYNAHRFILLRNENGFSSLDPLWCPSESIDGVEKCIESSSKNFYDNPGARNYRGIVERIDRFA